MLRVFLFVISGAGDGATGDLGGPAYVHDPLSARRGLLYHADLPRVLRDASEVRHVQALPYPRPQVRKDSD